MDTVTDQSAGNVRITHGRTRAAATPRFQRRRSKEGPAGRLAYSKSGRTPRWLESRRWPMWSTPGGNRSTWLGERCSATIENAASRLWRLKSAEFGHRRISSASGTRSTGINSLLKSLWSAPNKGAPPEAHNGVFAQKLSSRPSPRKRVRRDGAAKRVPNRESKAGRILGEPLGNQASCCDLARRSGIDPLRSQNGFVMTQRVLALRGFASGPSVSRLFEHLGPGRNQSTNQTDHPGQRGGNSPDEAVRRGFGSCGCEARAWFEISPPRCIDPFSRSSAFCGLAARRRNPQKPSV